MKKLKLLTVIALAVVLCVICVTSNTFSWFARPQTSKGNSLGWDINYDTSVGSNITMATYASTDDGENYGETPVTGFGRELTNGERICYRTDIINSGDTKQSVSLFLSDVIKESNTGEFYVGVNSPLKTYKNYSATISDTNTKVQSVVDKQNVYLGLDTGELNYLPGHVWGVKAWNNNGVSREVEWSKRQETTGTGTWKVDGYWNADRSYKIYAMQVPYSCTQMQFIENVNNGQKNYYQDPQPNISQYNTLTFFEYDGNYVIIARGSGKAAGINTFYSSANVSKGTTLDISASGQGKLTYTSSNTGVATVDSNGVVTGLSAGQTTITVTSTGAYKDTVTAQCVVTVTNPREQSLESVPIVTNLEIAPADESGPKVESVYWFIKNDSNGGALSYGVGELSLTL